MRVQSSEPLHAKMNPTSCLLDHSLYVLKPLFFPPSHAPKMRVCQQLFFELRFVSKDFQHRAIQTKIEQHFVGFFHKIHVSKPMQTMIQTSRRLDSFLHEAAQNFEIFQIFQSKILKSKPIAVD
jgi:hypothetical protein